LKIEHALLKSSGKVAVEAEAEQGVFPWFSDKLRERPSGAVVSCWTRSRRCSVLEESSLEVRQGDISFISNLDSRTIGKIVQLCIAKTTDFFVCMITDKGLSISACLFFIFLSFTLHMTW